MKTLLLIQDQLLKFIAFIFNIQLGFISVIGAFVVQYIFDDFQYLIFLGIALLSNAVMGGWAAVKQKNFSISIFFTELVVKSVLYMISLIVLHQLTRISINGESLDWLSWLSAPALFGFVVKEGLSAFVNIEKVKPGFIPSWIVSRLTEFNNEGKISSLAPNE